MAIPVEEALNGYKPGTEVVFNLRNTEGTHDRERFNEHLREVGLVDGQAYRVLKIHYDAGQPQLGPINSLENLILNGARESNVIFELDVDGQTQLFGCYLFDAQQK